MTAIKFCGLTRPEDAVAAAECGAAYVGVIFAGGRRLVDAAQARAILAQVRGRVETVGVFGTQTPGEIGRVADEVGLDIVQLHADPGVEAVAAVREKFGGRVWAVSRVRDGKVAAMAGQLADAADAVVLDAYHDSALGGTGQPLPWNAIAPAVVPLRGRRASIVLAGGLDSDNVAQAVALIAPDAVDVASGVESAPGIKDHEQLRAFASAVRGDGRRAGDMRR